MFSCSLRLSLNQFHGKLSSLRCCAAHSCWAAFTKSVSGILPGNKKRS